MTIDEYRAALESLSPEQFTAFRASWGGAQPTVEACVQEFAYAPDPVQWERIIVFRLRERGISNLRTEAEKLIAASQDSAVAAKVSASAAASSAESAAASVRWARWSVIVAVFAALIALLAGLSTVADLFWRG